jgi:DNA-binding transcriptional LysR family regulator
VEEITPLLLEKLRAGSVAMVALPLHMRGHEFQCLRLFSEKLFAVLPKRHRLARGGPFRWANSKARRFRCWATEIAFEKPPWRPASVCKFAHLGLKSEAA